MHVCMYVCLYNAVICMCACVCVYDVRECACD